MTITITFPPEYPYVMLSSLLIGFLCLLFGFMVAGRKRGQIFTEEYMKKNFLKEHMEAFPNDKAPPKGGYPDMGSGRYSQKLSYKEWYEFNIAQRIHMNYLEQALVTCFIILISGIKYPWPTVGLSLGYAFFRILVLVGYNVSVRWRKPGVIFLNFALAAMFYFSFDTVIGLM